MTFLLGNQVVANMNGLRLITSDENGNLCAEYDEAIRTKLDEKHIGTFLVPSWLKFIIEGFNSEWEEAQVEFAKGREGTPGCIPHLGALRW